MMYILMIMWVDMIFIKYNDTNKREFLKYPTGAYKIGLV